MKTVAIISEYNPFHSGHEYQIKKIREEFGNDTRIIAIMSGNYVQRGDVAFMDKSLRAEIAVRCGVNLVLELPFPFSISSAEFFSKSGISIINSLGIVDLVSFGSECGDIQILNEVADILLSEGYNKILMDLILSESNSGYAHLCEKAYTSISGNKIKKDFFTPNNILAIEYIKALKRTNSKALPHTISRLGADYNAESISKERFQSATALRSLIKHNINSALKYIPENAKDILLDRYSNKEFPCDSERLSPAIISYFRLNSQGGVKHIHDAAGGLYNRLQNASFEAETISKLTELADTKKFTSARIRRAIWYSFFGVTSSKISEDPCYTQVLAMDNIGKTILKEIKKVSSFPVLTKPSSYSKLSEKAKEQKSLSDKADSVFQLTKPEFKSGTLSIRTTPFIMT